MPSKGRSGGFIIFLTVALAAIVIILPMPSNVDKLFPPAVTLVLIYWWMALPERVGIATAFVCGLLMDVLTADTLGKHALVLVVTAFLTMQFHQRIRVYPVWQQGMVVCVLLYVGQLLAYLTNGLLGNPAPGWQFWVTPLIGGLIWPWLFIVMRDLRRHFHVH